MTRKVANNAGRYSQAIILVLSEYGEGVGARGIEQLFLRSFNYDFIALLLHSVSATLYLVISTEMSVT